MGKNIRHILISTCLSFCIAISIMILLELSFGGFVKPQNNSYDLDNFSLEDISDVEIMTNPDCYRAFMSRKFDDNFSELSDVETDRDYYLYSAKRITGVVTVHTTFANWYDSWAQSLSVLVNAKLNSGNATIFIICNGILVEKIELSEKKEEIRFSYQFDSNSDYCIKLVCNRASVQIEVEREWSY